MAKVKLKKIKLNYFNEKISKKPQTIVGELVKKKKTIKKDIKVLRKVAYERFMQTFPTYNLHKITNITIF